MAKKTTTTETPAPVKKGASVDSVKLKMLELIDDCNELAKGAVYPKRYINISRQLQQIIRNSLK